MKRWIKNNGLLLMVLIGLLSFLSYRYLIAPRQEATAQEKAVLDIRSNWEKTAPFSGTSSVGSDEQAKAVSFPAEVFDTKEIGILHVPAWGDDYVAAVVEGVTDDDMRDSAGHYPGTAMPGEIGNCALAAHRSPRGGLFYNLPDLEPGDLVVIETAMYNYIYKIYSPVEQVDYLKVDEIAPVPHNKEVVPLDCLLTLQTCEIGFNRERRLIAHGTLVQQTLK